MHGNTGKPDYRLMQYATDLLLCSRCLRSGVRTRVQQLISSRHRPRTLCRACREADRLRLRHPTAGQVVPVLAAWRERCRKATQ
jgi:hypothetical protein